MTPGPARGAIERTRKEHTCSNEPSLRKTEARQLCEENNLHCRDIRNAALSLYKEHSKHFPALPKSLEQTPAAVEIVDPIPVKMKTSQW